MDAEKLATDLTYRADKLDQLANDTNMALAEMRLQFETLAEMQKEERLERDKMHNSSVEKILDKCEREVKHWKHICIGLIVTICLIIGSLVGGVIYVLSNYDISFGYVQELYVGGDGNPTVNDGIHINDN